MSPDEPDSKPKRKVPASLRVADAAIILSLVALLAGATVMCSCPGFFVVMAVCAVVALVCGSRLQRLFSAALLLAAVAGFIHEFRAEQRMAEQVRRIQERAKQQNQ